MVAGKCGGVHHICDGANTNCTGLISNWDGFGRSHSPKSVLDPTNPVQGEFQFLARAYWQVYNNATLKKKERSEGLERFTTREQSPTWHTWFSYLNEKHHVLNAFEKQMDVPELWRPGSSLLDIGTGPGIIAAYLQAAYGTTAVGYDVPSTSQCSWFLSSPFKVMFTRGSTFPRIPERDKSFDAVTIMNTLHHVAELTPSVLQQAARIARRYILITEDFCEHPRSRHCLWLKREHDTKAIYRNVDEWRDMFKQHTNGFELVRFGSLWLKDRFGGVSNGPVTGTVRSLGRYKNGYEGMVWMVLERKQRWT